jgi:hypothetical protein
MTATPRILFAGATEESGKLPGSHVSLTTIFILRFLSLVAK